ncbi:MAG: phosphoribosylanthranilate isomerase [Caldimicrobium sp.]|nr:phosphoribosylanthranilate isomerase [Caldimicrobium sp.]MCX7873494.1 phosphoribosylanthranilate isomerase [Caldimicrobium sp.]MDW8093820.1 phosphoribosylanthranilate isomerase [Caldimicrobium sp.]
MRYLVKVKICGVTKVEDIILLENFSVDYLGFIMYPLSPRYVGEKLKELLTLVKKAKKVVVLVDPSEKEAKEVLDLGADLIQLHGNENLEIATKIGLHRVIKAFRVKEPFDFKRLEPWKQVYAILLDTYQKGIPGGTGKTFNWEIARRTVLEDYRVFLAGGLNPNNVIEAINIVRPYAIDISSGLESEPGIKDPEKVKALFEALKERRVEPHP